MLDGNSPHISGVAALGALGNTSDPHCPKSAGTSHQERSGIFFQSAEPSVLDVSCQKGRNNMLRFHTLQSPDLFQALTFRKGDSVFLAKGSCQGTVGNFLNFRR
jgi:hypothetical protein